MLKEWLVLKHKCVNFVLKMFGTRVGLAQMPNFILKDAYYTEGMIDVNTNAEFC